MGLKGYQYQASSSNTVCIRSGSCVPDRCLKQTCVSILFVGYILMQVPSNLFLNKIGRPSIYLTSCMAIWVRAHLSLSFLIKKVQGL